MFFSAILDSKTPYQLDDNTPDSSVVHITKAVLQEPKGKGLLYIKSTSSSQYPEVVVASLNEKSPQVELDMCVVHGQGVEFRMNPPCKVALVGYVDPTSEMMMSLADGSRASKTGEAGVSTSDETPELSTEAVEGNDSDSNVDGSESSESSKEKEEENSDQTKKTAPDSSLTNKSQKDQVKQIMDELSINDNSEDSVERESSDTGSESYEADGAKGESSSEEAPEPVKEPAVNKKRKDAPEKKASPAKKKKEETKPPKETKAKTEPKQPKSTGDPEADFEKALIASLKNKSRIPLGALGMEVKKPKEVKVKYGDFIKARPSIFKMQGHMVELKEK